MRYLLEAESIIEKKFFFKGNPEINVGKLYRNVKLETRGNTKFLKKYDPKIGIQAHDIEGFNFEALESIKEFKRYIFFSPYMRKATKENLEKIFNKLSKDYYDSYHSEFTKLGWDYDDYSLVVFGEIKITVLDKRPHMSELLQRVNSFIKLERDEIIRKCGYIDDENNLDYITFYENFCDALKLNKITTRSNYLKEFLHKKRRRITPLVQDARIYGGNTFFISDRQGEKEWSVENWDYEDDENFNGPYEVGDPHGSKGYFEGYFDYDSAISAFAFRDNLGNLLRPAYDEFCVVDYDDWELNDYLAERGEHPKVLIELTNRIKKTEPYFYY
jgi:hypothetical protein